MKPRIARRVILAAAGVAIGATLVAGSARAQTTLK